MRTADSFPTAALLALSPVVIRAVFAALALLAISTARRNLDIPLMQLL